MEGKTLKVGQKLWWVPSGRRHDEQKEVTVLKVGRKWATLDNCHRIDIWMMIADGGGYSPPGSCYFSREEHEKKLALSREWGRLKLDLTYKSQPPAGVTVEDIARVRELLRIPDQKTK